MVAVVEQPAKNRSRSHPKPGSTATEISAARKAAVGDHFELVVAHAKALQHRVKQICEWHIGRRRIRHDDDFGKPMPMHPFRGQSLYKWCLLTRC